MVRIQYIILTLLFPLFGWGQVPDNNSFSLDTVTKVIGASNNTLQTCLDEAHPDGWDATYVGDTNSLYSFRNYDHYEEQGILKSVYTDLDNASIQNSGSTWSTTQSDGSGSSVLSSSSYYHVRVEDESEIDGFYNWYIERAFICFYLSDIPSDAIIVDAKFAFLIKNESYNVSSFAHEFDVYKATYNANLTTGDFDEYDADTALTTASGYSSGGLYWKDASSSGESYIESKFGQVLEVALIHNIDRSSTPSDNIYSWFELFRNGECLISTEYGCSPQLEVDYLIKNPN